MKVLKAVSETASWMSIVIVVTMTDLLLRGNPENGIAGAEKTLRDEFEHHPSTQPFWDQLKTEFVFVSKGMMPGKKISELPIRFVPNCQRRRP